MANQAYQDSIRPGFTILELAEDEELAVRLLAGRVAECTYCSRPVPSLSFPSLFQYLGPESKAAANHCSHVKEVSEQLRRQYPDRIWTCGMTPCAHLPINPLTDRPTNLDHEFVPGPGRDTDEHYCGCRGWN